MISNETIAKIIAIGGFICIGILIYLSWINVSFGQSIGLLNGVKVLPGLTFLIAVTAFIFALVMFVQYLISRPA